MFQKSKKHNRGYTLIEILVALSIFVLVILSVVEITGLLLRAQRKAIAQQVLQENVRFALERMTKEIRMSKINTPSGVSPSLNITAHKESGDINVTYALSSNRLIRVAGGASAFLTSSAVSIKSLNFYVVNGLNQQPRATIVLKAETTDGLAEIRVQTTISSRDYSI